MIAKDPVCGMPVDSAEAVGFSYGGTRLLFCSEFCRQQFERHPAVYDVPGRPPPSEPRWPTRRVAYFSMEVACQPTIPTYAGGLGVLAGDHLRACADLGLPVVGVSLVHREGYFRQRIRDGEQREAPDAWDPAEWLRPVARSVQVEIEGRVVRVGGWQFDFVGSSGHVVPLILLDTDHPDNPPADREITNRLYGGDEALRLAQEIVLGVGGVRMLLALGCSRLRTFHLNEGHAALAPLELLRSTSTGGEWDFATVRRRCVFTTHTPVAAGHDRFDAQLTRRLLGGFVDEAVLRMLGGDEGLNMTALALNLSHFVNGVALRHREVSSALFPRQEIHQVTNGVHSVTWTSDPFRTVFDQHIPGWRSDPWMLRNATALPASEVEEAHRTAKTSLFEVVRARTGVALRPDALTIGFARRSTAYKRPALVFRDPARLRTLASSRPLQFVFAGKAHPADDSGKQAIREVIRIAGELGTTVPVVFVEGHDLELARQLVAGADVWLNTPRRPLEASGTSGMKAAHNGVPSLSVLDGWWLEGHVEGVTGWSIGSTESLSDEEADQADAADLYDKLERAVLPAFYDRPAAWTDIMRQCIALNAAFFNAHRMAAQYAAHAYPL